MITTPLGRLHQLDAIELLRTLDDESVDLAIFDPPYESLEKWRATGTTTRLSHSKSSSNDWFKTFPNKLYPILFHELYRVMKRGTFIYMFCDEETRDIVCCGFSPQSGASISVSSMNKNEVWSPVTHAGFKYWKALVWDKMVPGMGYHFPAQHEFILMAEKVLKKNKHRRLNTNRPGDVLQAKRLKGKDYYPTEKPAPLIWKLVTESSEVGDTVLDMFCGSGVVGEVCAMTGRKYILGDIDISAAKQRMAING